MADFVVNKRDELRENWQSTLDGIEFRPRWKYAIQTTKNHLLDAGDDPQIILWSHIARSGKRYMMFGLIQELIENPVPITKDKNFLIITTAPGETLAQYIDVSGNLSGEGYNVQIVDAKSIKENTADGSKNVYIASKQLLTHRANKNYSLENVGIIFFDEAHHGGTTDLSKDALEKYSGASMIFLAATYFKVKANFDIDAEISWNLHDIEIAKAGCVEALEHKYPGITECWDANACDVYSAFPGLVTICMDTTPVYHTKLLAMDKEKTCLKHPDKVNEMFASAIKAIRGIDDAMVQRRILNPEDPTVIMCFVNRKQIKRVSELLDELLSSKYDFLEICRCHTLDENTDRTGVRIAKSISLAKRKGKEAVFVITGAMGHLGVTIPKCDVVIRNSSVKE